MTKKHIETTQIDSILFSIYRDDSLDILRRGLIDEQEYRNHMDSLHRNLRWDVNCTKEGPYLDLWLMLRDGKIEWKTYTKTPPLYLHRRSCHDPTVTKGIPKGVGIRLRMTNSTEEGFDENVELYSRALAVSGYKYKKVKSDLKKLKNIDPKEVINSDKKKSAKKACSKVFWVSKFAPRVPHPRKIISKNYHIIKDHPIASKLFPRENLVAGSRRLPNLSEILSPTVQSSPPGQEVTGGPGGGGAGGAGEAGGGDDDGDSDQDEGGGARRRRAATGGSTRGRSRVPDETSSCEQSVFKPNGSFHCIYNKKSKGKCDVCSHMQETRTVLSKHFMRKHAISGHNTHLAASVKPKTRWFVYLEEDSSCGLQYVGSTSSMTHRWANTKKKCSERNSNWSGLEAHFREGCPGHISEKLSHISITLLEHMDVTPEELNLKKT